MPSSRPQLLRRQFLRRSLATLAATSLTPAWAEAGSPAFLAAAKTGESHALFGLTERGAEIFRIALPSRGHAGCAHPNRAEAVAFARRPGTYALVLDCRDGALRARLTPPQGRQFNGHGTFSADGSLLYTSEVVAEGSEGRIGLWETRSWARLGEVPSHGIGPHEILRLKGSDVLVVANGGIQTDPSDRSPLNLNTMRPNLAFLSADGQVLDLQELPELSQNSIRHIAQSDGAIAFAMQWQGDPAEAVPLLGLTRQGETPRLLESLLGEELAMQGYGGSVAFSGDKLAMTSPKGGRVQVWSRAGEALYSVAQPDVCGLGPCQIGGDFTVTDGRGQTALISATGAERCETLPLAWDNHLVSL